MLVPTATNQGAPVRKSTRNAPNIIAGHQADPHRKSAVTARPEGTQTSVANPLTAPSMRPNRPVPTYSAARISSLTTYQPTPLLEWSKSFRCVSFSGPSIAVPPFLVRGSLSKVDMAQKIELHTH